jgi:HEAT repeat protein
MDNDRLIELESLLRNGSRYQQKTALDALAQCSSELAVPLLQRVATDSPDFLCRRLAVIGLGKHQTPEVFQILQERLDQEQDHNVLAEIANVLFDFGEGAIPLLTQLFKQNPHWLLRQTILAILVEGQEEEALFAVVEDGLKDETQTVRETAILALGSLVEGDFQEQVLDLLSELAVAPFWRDRWRTATALTKSKNPKTTALLAKLQQDGNHYVAAAALEGALPN